jgi:multimeric flavodoxin WrbA
MTSVVMPGAIPGSPRDDPGKGAAVNAICLNCTLKRSPEESSTASLSDVVMSALREEGVDIDTIRLADHTIEPGVVSEAVTEGDEWPAIRERILAADILVVATPTWLGQPSSVSKRALERMDAFLSETRDDGATPIAFNRVAGVVVVGNEDGAHHCISEISGALVDIGYTIPAQSWTYWNKGPGPGEEEWLTTDEREWSITTGQTAARNLLAVARALQAHPIPPPPG